MNDLQTFLNFAINVIGPVVVLLAFGYLLYKRDLLNDDFVERASGLIFSFALPALLFINISAADLTRLIDVPAISVGIAGTLIVFFVTWLAFHFSPVENVHKGVIVQSIFRSNMGIIGLAYCAKAYGTEGLAYGSIYMGCLTIVYNVISVVILNFYQNQKTDVWRISKGVITNPIILAISAGLVFSYFQVPLPEIAQNSIGYFAQLTLPLALLCTGAAMRFSALSKDWKLTALAIFGKVIFYPIVLISMAMYLGISGQVLGIIFLMAMSPTAAASYVMVRKIGGNHQLAAQIIALGTVISLPVTVLAYGLMLQISNIA